jgi:hypothetical protein
MKRDSKEGDMTTTRNEAINKGNPFFYFSSRVHANLAMFAHKAAGVPQALKERFRLGSAPRACGDRTGAACVLSLIRNSGRGVHPRVLAQMTGYNQERLDRILHKLFKHGEIMVEAGGVYAEAKPRVSQGLREV